MRKNGIHRELLPVEGGVCAPEGFKANAVSCGIRAGGGLDFGMIFSEKRCSVGCVYATSRTVGAPVRVSKKNMRNGYIRAILVNGGVANSLGENGERLAYQICDLLFPQTIERTEIVLASTGELGKYLDIAPFERGIDALYNGLEHSHTHSERVAEAIRSEGAPLQHYAFAFDLGDYPCKIGVICKGGRQVSPNMATFLAFLTTDVNISSPMLQKALEAEVRETLNMLNVDGAPSPNDTVCIMANGRAGNYKIDCEDSEYKKFRMALRAVLTEICKGVAGEGDRTIFTCTVTEAQSKQVARAIAKSIVGSEAIKKSIRRGSVDIDGVFCMALASDYEVNVEGLQILLRSSKGEVLLYGDGRKMTGLEERVRELVCGAEVELRLSLREGNFQAKAFGCF